MLTYSRRFFMIAIITVPMCLFIFSCSTVDNSISAPTESHMAKLGKNSEPTKIMCLGDSFTYGKNGNNKKTSPGYRKLLSDMLKGKDYDFEFVGSKTDGGGKYEGHDGYSIRRIIDEKLANALKHQPDIILLHVGHNKVSEGSKEKWVDRADDLEELLDMIDKEVHVIVAKIVHLKSKNKWSGPNKSDGQNDEGLIAYNDEVGNRVNARKNKGDKISLVKMTDNVEQGKDGCHPTLKGYEQMATIWFNELKKYLKKKGNRKDIVITFEVGDYQGYDCKLNPIIKSVQQGESVQVKLPTGGDDGDDCDHLDINFFEFNGKNYHPGDKITVTEDVSVYFEWR